MKNVKKLLALLLVFAMVFALVGCTNTPKPDDTKADTQKEETKKDEPAKDTETEKAETDEKGDEPAPEGDLTPYEQAIADRRAEYEKTGEYQKVVYAIYTWIGKPAGTERIQEEMNKILREKLCLEIELMVLDFASYRQNIQLNLTNNDEQVDWFGGNALGYTSCVNNGFCYDMEEDNLIETYGPGICELISEEYRDACKFDGKLTGIPPMKDIAINCGAMMIGKEYLDAIGYEYHENENQEVPTTWDEIEKIFTQLHEKFPDKYVFAVGGNQFGQGSIVDNIGNDWFGVLLDPTKDKTVVNLFESDEWMTMVKRMYDWNQNKGFMSADALTDTTSISAKCKSGQYMAMLSQAKPGYKSQISGECGREMIVFILGQPIVKSSGVSNVITCLNQASPDPIAAMQVMNELYTDPELSTLLVWGQEGIDYVFTDDGHITFPDGVDAQNAEWYHTMNWELPNQYLTPCWVGDPLDLGQKTMEFNNSAPKSLAMGFTFDNSEFTAEYAALQSAYDEYANQLLYGFLDPEKGTAEFNEKLKAAGLDEYIAEKQRQLDAWFAAQ